MTRAVFLLLCLLGLSLGPVSALAHPAPERAAAGFSPAAKTPPLATITADTCIVDDKKQCVLLVSEDTDGGCAIPHGPCIGRLSAPILSEQFKRSGARPLLSVGAPRGPPLQS